MHGAAEWMYEHAKEYGCENRDEMYLLGLVIKQQILKTK